MRNVRSIVLSIIPKALLTHFSLADDGYRLTYGGLDYLALHAHQKSKAVYSVGNQIGVGKESDIIVVANSTGTQHVLKIHRLGRISFRTVKNNRDYLRNRSSASWMYMSRLAAMKEYAFLNTLRDNGFPVPEPVAQNRHTIVMGLIDAFPMRQVSSVPDPATLYSELLEMILRLAEHGLIHGDFNEFNILIKEVEVTPEEKEAEESDSKEPSKSEPEIKLVPILIDFPQMVSVDHPNAEMYFDRDVNCIKRYFKRRFHFTSDVPGPFFSEAKKRLAKGAGKRLDVEVEASGFSKKMAKELETYMKEVGVDGDARLDADGNEVEVSDEEDDDEEDGSDGEEEDEDEEQQEEAESSHDVDIDNLKISDPVTEGR